MIFLLQPPPLNLDSERTRVLNLLKTILPREAEVWEVGSTAIAGAIGKQDVDLLVRVPRAAFAATRAALDQAFPKNPDQMSNDVYQGYCVPSALDIAIQCTEKDGPYDNFLDFLEALRRSPERVEAYNALKRAWDGRRMEEYRAAKALFIEETLATNARRNGPFEGTDEGDLEGV